MPSLSEVLIILLIIMLIFGASRLPKLGDALGRAIRNVVKPDDDTKPSKRDDET